MKHSIFLFLALLMMSCNVEVSTDLSKEDQNEKVEKALIQVGVFNRNGDSPYCIDDAIEALEIDPDIDARIISASDILAGKTEDLDVYLFPGGSGRSETSSLGEQGMEKIIDKVKDKGSVLHQFEMV